MTWWNIIATIALGAVAVLCVLVAWAAHRTYTTELDRWGAIYGCKRWPSEPNASYLFRLRARIGSHWGRP